MKNNILKTFTAISSTLKRSNFGIFPPEAKFCCCTFLRMPPLLFPDLEQGGGFLKRNSPDNSSFQRLPRRCSCVANVQKIYVLRPRPRVSVCPRFSVVSSKPTSTRDMIFTFIYSSQWKKLDFWTVQIFDDRTKYRIYTSQKSRLNHPDTKGVLIDTDKTLIISHFLSI